MNEQLLDRMIKRGVKRISDLGYPEVNIFNIFSDYIYSDMFRIILKNGLGKGYDNEIKELLSRIKHNHED